MSKQDKFIGQEDDAEAMGKLMRKAATEKNAKIAQKANSLPVGGTFIDDDGNTIEVVGRGTGEDV